MGAMHSIVKSQISTFDLICYDPLLQSVFIFFNLLFIILSNSLFCQSMPATLFACYCAFCKFNIWNSLKKLENPTFNTSHFYSCIPVSVISPKVLNFLWAWMQPDIFPQRSVGNYKVKDKNQEPQYFELGPTRLSNDPLEETKTFFKKKRISGSLALFIIRFLSAQMLYLSVNFTFCINVLFFTRATFFSILIVLIISSHI